MENFKCRDTEMPFFLSSFVTDPPRYSSSQMTEDGHKSLHPLLLSISQAWMGTWMSSGVK